MPRKTYIMKGLPGPFSPSLMRHLLRGFVDADGYFTITRYGFGVGAFSKEVVEDIQNWFVSELGLSRTTLIHSGNWHYRKFGSVQVSKIASYLYGNASIYLDRKYHLAQRILLSTRLGISSNGAGSPIA